MLTIEMLSDLCCPASTREKLRVEIEKQEDNRIIEGKLICDKCGEIYPVQAGIPDLIPKRKTASAEWRMWQDHLDGFQERREQRVENPERLATKMGKKSQPQRKFAEFTRIHQGKVLDVGCGPGKFRFNFNRNAVTYYGLDPIVHPQVENFPFVRALSEYIPFKDGTFSHMIIVSALDHFKDLETFFQEARRVLKPDGKLHIVQSVHELKGPISAAKMLAHWLKDLLENRATKIKNPRAPKHISEFSTSTLRACLSSHFSVEAVSTYNYRWYYPTNLFFTLSPLGVDDGGGRAPAQPTLAPKQL